MSAKTSKIYYAKPLMSFVPRLTDTFGIIGSVLLIAYSPAHAISEDVWLAAAVGVAVYYLSAEVTGLFRSWHGVKAEKEIACALLTWCVAAPLLLLLGFLTGKLESCQSELTHWGLVRWLLIAPAMVAGLRIFYRLFLRMLRLRGVNSRGFAIIGANELGFQLARNIDSSPQMGLKLVGFFDDRPAARRETVPSEVGQCLGNLDDLQQLAKDGTVHIIYITLPLRAEQRVKAVLQRLADTTASVYLVPDFFVFELLHSRWTNIGGLPAVSIFETPFYGVGGAIKRATDFMLSILILLMVSLPMLVIAAAIKLTSRGPVFFRQKRYGLDGRPIDVWKFRSMRVMENGAAVTQAKQGDPRVTPLGAFLRKSSLDELPQLFNVLEGSMSLVGPRPHANAHNEEYRSQIQGYMLRHKVKPGITGLAQVSGWRGETDTLDKMAKRVECDHAYIRDWSPWLDLSILFRTIFTVLKRQNAY